PTRRNICASWKASPSGKGWTWTGKRCAAPRPGGCSGTTSVRRARRGSSSTILKGISVWGKTKALRQQLSSGAARRHAPFLDCLQVGLPQGSVLGQLPSDSLHFLGDSFPQRFFRVEGSPRLPSAAAHEPAAMG